MSDGLTVPFALAAGLSGAVASTGIGVTGRFGRKLAAGSVPWVLEDISLRVGTGALHSVNGSGKRRK